MQADLDGLRQMDRLSSCRLKDLLATTKTIRHNQCVLLGAPHSRQEYALAHCLGYDELVSLESERSGHPATARIQRLQFTSGLSQQGLFIIHLHECLVMAVTMEQDFARDMRRLISGLTFKKFAEQESLAPQSDGAFFPREQVLQLVTKDRGTARL